MEFEYDKDNLERSPIEHYEEEFAKADPEEIAERCHLDYDAETKEFKVRVMNKEYYVSFPDSTVRKVNENDNEYHSMLEFYKTKVLLLRYMLYGKYVPSSGSFVTYRDIPNGEMYFQPFQGRCIFRLQFGFGYKINKFIEGMESIGGRKVKMGDVAYEFDILDGFSMVFILWEGDEEFQPSAQILFSDNFPLAFEAEDLAVAGDISIGNLKAVTK
jgi:hypothetical protein